MYKFLEESSLYALENRVNIEASKGYKLVNITAHYVLGLGHQYIASMIKEEACQK